MEISTRKPYFVQEEDHGLASLAEMEAGVSSQNAVVSGPLYYTKRNSLRNMNYLYPQTHYHHQYSVSSPRSVVVSGRFHDSRFENGYYSHQQPHFLDSCSLCKKPLEKRDIYMYRGNTPFCSEECRQEQIERDEAKEKKQSLSSSMKAMRRKEQSSSASSSPTRSPDYAFNTGTVAAA